MQQDFYWGTGRGFSVWGIFTFVLLGAFVSFVAAGWPGSQNPCTKDVPTNTCYCEQYKLADVLKHAPGVRQPVNTWFNLYSIGTSFWLAWLVYRDRKSGQFSDNPIRSNTGLPDLYIFVVLFLGLGSMWFHGSLIEWAGVFDMASVFAFALFLVFYTIYRMWPNQWFFWFGWSIATVLVTVIGYEWKSPNNTPVLIGIVVPIYIGLEIATWALTKTWFGGFPAGLLWWFSVACIIGATVAWALSQTGGPWCNPTSFWQPHGLLWHPLAGAMALFLFFYWRRVGRVVRPASLPQSAGASA